jgi:hypothetical protein
MQRSMKFRSKQSQNFFMKQKKLKLNVRRNVKRSVSQLNLDSRMICSLIGYKPMKGSKMFCSKRHDNEISTLNRRKLKLIEFLDKKYVVENPEAQLIPAEREMPSSIRKRNSIIKHQSRIIFRSPGNQWKVRLSNVIVNKLHAQGRNQLFQLGRRRSLPIECFDANEGEIE